MKIDAVILAGGKGTRLQEVVKEVPKPLALVGDHPFLDLLLQKLNQTQKINKVILALGYKADKIIEYYRGALQFSFSIEFSLESHPLGTGGAIRLALEKTDSNPLLVLNGDTYVDFDLGAFLNFHSSHKSALTIALVQVDDVTRFGEVEWDENSFRIKRFIEKNSIKKQGLINGGAYLLKNDLIKGLGLGESFSFEKDAIPTLLKNGIYGFVTKGKFIDIGTPESYKKAEDYLKD